VVWLLSLQQMLLLVPALTNQQQQHITSSVTLRVFHPLRLVVSAITLWQWC
jgi:hypothetical protein